MDAIIFLIVLCILLAALPNLIAAGFAFLFIVTFVLTLIGIYITDWCERIVARKWK
jgi:hypothetical membrane protein